MIHLETLGAKMIDADMQAHIVASFPEIEQIASGDLRQKTIDVFALALERSTWDDLNQIPNLFVSREPMGNYVAHNRTVAQMCQQSARILRSYGHDTGSAGRAERRGTDHVGGACLLEQRRPARRSDVPPGTPALCVPVA